MDLTLDRLKHKGAIKRVLFLHNKLSQYSKNMTVSNSQGPACEELQAYLIVSKFIHIYLLDRCFYLKHFAVLASSIFDRKSILWPRCSWCNALLVEIQEHTETLCNSFTSADHASTGLWKVQCSFVLLGQLKKCSCLYVIKYVFALCLKADNPDVWHWNMPLFCFWKGTVRYRAKEGFDLESQSSLSWT